MRDSAAQCCNRGPLAAAAGGGTRPIFRDFCIEGEPKRIPGNPGMFLVGRMTNFPRLSTTCWFLIATSTPSTPQQLPSQTFRRHPLTASQQQPERRSASQNYVDLVNQGGSGSSFRSESRRFRHPRELTLLICGQRDFGSQMNWNLFC